MMVKLSGGDRALKGEGGGRMLFGRPILALGFPCHL